MTAQETTMPPGDIHTSLRRGALGDTAGLWKAIRRDGMRHPIVIDSHHNLIDGERRLYTALHSNSRTVPVVIVHTLDEAEPYILAALEDVDHALPRTYTETMRVADSFMALDEAARQERASQRGRLNRLGVVREKDGSHWTQNRIARLVGLSSMTFYRVAKLWMWAHDEELPEEYRGLAQEAMQEIDLLGNVSRHFANVREAIPDRYIRTRKTIITQGRQPAGGGGPVVGRTQITDVKGQKMILDNIAVTLGGISYTLAQIAHPHPDLDPGDIEDWTKVYARARTALNQTLRNLKSLQEDRSNNQ